MATILGYSPTRAYTLNDYTTDEEISNKIKEWWVKNGLVVVISITVSVGSFGGINYWNTARTEKAENLSVNYSQLLIAVNEDRFDTAVVLAEAIIKYDEQSNYAILSKMLLAKIKFEAGENLAAADILKEVMATGTEMQLNIIARERLARISLQEGNLEDAKRILLDSKQQTPNRSFELLGDIYHALDDVEAAKISYKKGLDYYQKSNQDTSYIQLKINMLENLKSRNTK